MIAGSETGAIIGSFLSIANDDIKNKDVQPNKFWAANITKIFEDQTDKLWYDKQIPMTARIIIIVVITGLGVWSVKNFSQLKFNP